MYGLDHPRMQSRAAALLRSVANDLKRDDAGADADLGLPAGSFARYVSGERPVTWDLIERAVRVWPVNERDLLPVHDDCPGGVRIFRVADSVKSSRVIERGGRPYYEYRDTAMSRVASFRPEWIRTLVTADGGADDPLVCWNNGHLLYQFTYFVGPVNYYYEWNGVRHVARMSTGDSVWGLPFAPHSFTARDDSEPAYILALTYGGGLVGDAQRELAVLGEAVAGTLAVGRDRARAQAELLCGYLRSRVMTEAELARRSGIAEGPLGELLAGARTASDRELAALAGALAASERDLLAPRAAAVDGVAIQRAAGAAHWPYPDGATPAYLVTRLAADPAHPHTTGLELRVLRGDVAGDAFLVTHQHQYLYVLGDEPALLVCDRNGDRTDVVLEPGDSVYLKPGVRFALATAGSRPFAFPAAGSRSPRILVLRIECAVTTDVRFALGSMPPAGIRRYLAESTLWY